MNLLQLLFFQSVIHVAVYIEETGFKLVLVEQKFKESFYEKDQFLGIPVAPTVDVVQALARSWVNVYLEYKCCFG